VEFSVNSTALVGLVDLMDRRWQDFEAGRGYLRGNAHFAVTGPGVLNAITGTHQRIVDQVDGFLRTAAEGFAGSYSVAVTEAINLYRHSDLAAAIRAGLTKINIATQLNKVFTAAVRDYLSAEPAVVDPRRYGSAGRDAVAPEVTRLLGVLSACGAGRAGGRGR